MRSAGLLGRIGLLGALLCALSAPVRAADFAPPPNLRVPVDFWISVYAVYGRNQMLIHDNLYLDRVYRILDYRDLARDGVSNAQIDARMKNDEATEKARVQAMLRRLHENDDPGGLSPEELRLRAMFAADPSPTKYLDAAASERLRGQRGIRERFAHGIQTGHAYFPQMEVLFRRTGVPVEITRLPLIESTFNMKAYSKVGAAGVWQFMPGTARSFMRVGDVVDERLDPLIATRAAAQFMRQNYEKLGTWPLAIKAYNHGPAGMARAVRETGTRDIATIIRRYQGPAFKFASRNFYPGFLAAVHVERNYKKYFGDLPLHELPPTEDVRLDGPTSIISAARCAGVDAITLGELNPSLLPPARTGRAPIPDGFTLRVPAGHGAQAAQCADSLPVTRFAPREAPPKRASAARDRGARGRTVHRVTRGQTLSGIAARYGCSVDQLRRGNALKGGGVQAGQLLRIPPC